jgi:hypothetical protein
LSVPESAGERFSALWAISVSNFWGKSKSASEPIRYTGVSQALDAN